MRPLAPVIEITRKENNRNLNYLIVLEFELDQTLGRYSCACYLDLIVLTTAWGELCAVTGYFFKVFILIECIAE